MNIIRTKVKVSYNGAEKVVTVNARCFQRDGTLTATSGGVGQMIKGILSLISKANGGFKFTVQSESYSMGSSVYVGVGSPDVLEEVEKAIKPFAYGYFDGREDIYEYTGKINVKAVDGTPIEFGVKFLCVQSDKSLSSTVSI
jgi:hypothetical protein